MLADTGIDYALVFTILGGQDARDHSRVQDGRALDVARLELLLLLELGHGGRRRQDVDFRAPADSDAARERFMYYPPPSHP